MVLETINKPNTSWLIIEKENKFMNDMNINFLLNCNSHLICKTFLSLCLMCIIYRYAYNQKKKKNEEKNATVLLFRQ